MDLRDDLPWFLWLLLIMAVVFSTASAHADEAIKLDSNLKVYAKVSGVSGNLNSIGSDTLNNLMTLWAEGFRKQYPNVKIQIEGKGSSTAPPALIDGTAQMGPMSRAIRISFIAKYLERIADHATNVAELVVYMVDGKIIRHTHG